MYSGDGFVRVPAFGYVLRFSSPLRNSQVMWLASVIYCGEVAPEGTPVRNIQQVQTFPFTFTQATKSRSISCNFFRSALLMKHYFYMYTNQSECLLPSVSHNFIKHLIICTVIIRSGLVWRYELLWLLAFSKVLVLSLQKWGIIISLKLVGGQTTLLPPLRNKLSNVFVVIRIPLVPDVQWALLRSEQGWEYYFYTSMLHFFQNKNVCKCVWTVIEAP